MRKIIALFTVLTICTFWFTGCKGSAALTPFNENWNDYNLLDETEMQIRKTADSAIIKEYSFNDLSNFKIKYTHSTSSVVYTLMFGKYETEESYHVTFNDNGGYEIKDVNGGMYSCYLGYVTDAAIKKAEKNLTEQVRQYGEQLIPRFYLSVDNEGYLCLTNEVITASGNDHQHKFLTERICKKPN